MTLPFPSSLISQHTTLNPFSLCGPCVCENSASYSQSFSNMGIPDKYKIHVSAAVWCRRVTYDKKQTKKNKCNQMYGAEGKELLT